jgi:hypothetical protein
MFPHELETGPGNMRSWLRSIRERWEQRPTEIPMPGLATHASAWILQWLELETGLVEPDRRTESEQALTIGGHEMRHLAPFPDVAV